MILGVMGQAGSGKDTMADYLVKEHGFVKMSLADVIKRISKELFDFSELQLWGPSEERNKPDFRYAKGGLGEGYLSPRVALQFMGTEIGRSLYKNVWVDYLMRCADAVQAGTHTYDKVHGLRPVGVLERIKRKVIGFKAPGVVIPDVRFENELIAINNAGGKVVRLRREGKNGEVGIAGHASEEEQKSIPDYRLAAGIEVPEGYEKFYQAIDVLMVTLRGLN